MLLHPVHDGHDQDGAEIRGVVPLSHVALDGNRVPGLEAVGQPCVIEELGWLGGEAGVPVVHEVDLTRHSDQTL